MRTIIDKWTLWVYLLLVTLLVSCSSDDEKSIVEPSLEVSPIEIDFKMEQGTKEVLVSTNVNTN